MANDRPDIKTAPFRERPTPLQWRNGLASCLLLLALMLAAPGLASAQVVPRGITIEQIAASPAVYYGQTVEVRGDIAVIVGQRSFLLEDPNLLSNAAVLVVSRQPLRDDLGQLANANVTLPENVFVRGTVWPFNLVEVERRLGLDLDDAAFAPLTGRPVILASSVVNTTYAISPLGQTVEGQRGATVDAIAENPARYYGRLVTVYGDFEESLGPRTFIIEDEDLFFAEQILVVASRPLLTRYGHVASPGQLLSGVVRVRGTVLPFNVAEVERRLGTDLDDLALIDYAGEPAILADSIIPLAPTLPRR